MTAYMIVQSYITDEAGYSDYRRAVMPLIQEFGGRHLRGGDVVMLEGMPDGGKIALFEFPSMDAIRSFWTSPEYVVVKKLREDAARLNIWAVPSI